MKVSINGWPISAGFGSVDSSHHSPHRGIDFAVNTGTPVPSIGDGTIVALTDEGTKSFGKAVHILTPDGDEVIYGHLSEFKGLVGQIVHKGDILALSGNTGRSDGPHLHLQVMHNGQAVDPTPFLESSVWDGVKAWFAQGHYKAGGTGVVGTDDSSWWIVLYDHAIQGAAGALMALGHILNKNSTDIVTFAIVVCALGAMVSPLIGTNTSKWYGRMTGAFFGGVLWRALL